MSPQYSLGFWMLELIWIKEPKVESVSRKVSAQKFRLPLLYGSTLSVRLTCSISQCTQETGVCIMKLFKGFIPSWMSFLQPETDWNHFRSGRQEFTTQRGLQLRQNLWSPITSLHSLLWRSLHPSLSVFSSLLPLLPWLHPRLLAT